MLSGKPLRPWSLACDVAGCGEEIAIRVGEEQRCFAHAVERANEYRCAASLPPLVTARRPDGKGERA